MYALSAALLLLLLLQNVWHKLLRRNNMQSQLCKESGHTGQKQIGLGQAFASLSDCV